MKKRGSVLVLRLSSTKLRSIRLVVRVNFLSRQGSWSWARSASRSSVRHLHSPELFAELGQKLAHGLLSGLQIRGVADHQQIRFDLVPSGLGNLAAKFRIRCTQQRPRRLLDHI